jgi:colicin import membrane protein
VATPAEGATRDTADAQLVRAEGDQAETYLRLRRDLRAGQEKFREMAASVAATECMVATTMHRLAERALREGREDDARRLEARAAHARGVVEQEHRQMDRVWEEAGSPPGWDGAQEQWAAAGRARNEAARKRDEAARQRDEAARQRDEAARKRDELAVVRDKEAEERGHRTRESVVFEHRRDAAAGEPPEAEEHRSRLGMLTAGDVPIDEDVEAIRGTSADADRRRATERQQNAADRDGARQDRLAAARDRDAARADREAAARDRAAAQADRERSE